MRRTLAIPLLSMALASCGGGDGGGAGAPQPAATPPPPQLFSAYLGEWQTPCDFHQIDSISVTRQSGDSIAVTPRTDYYAEADCSGALLATETLSTPFIIKHSGSGTAGVVFAENTPAVQLTVDKIGLSVGQHSLIFTGPGVVHTVKDGQPQWCVNYNDGGSTCTFDDGVMPAASTSGAMYVTEREMYTLVPLGSLYAVETKYVRK